jgi:hypothetical protein
MWRARLLSTVIGLSLAATRTVIAQRDAEPTGKNFHKIISLDSVEFRGLGASPDGRWLTIGAVCSLTACSVPWGGEDGIWIMPSDGRAKPARLLSAGYNDRWPVWFPSGDRLAFVSDRMSRDGSHKTYAMTVPIDPKTGRATAPPRQISTDEATDVGQVSPDGKWVTYGVFAEHVIKVVPATGGASRTLVTMAGAGPPFIWSRDGKTLYFVVRGGPAPPPVGGVWYKVSADGGAATRAYENASAMPYAPNTDMHVVFVRRNDAARGGVRRVELYDAKERLVGAFDVTGDMNFFFPRGASSAYAATANRRYENFLLTLDGGRTRMLAASRFAWVNGWIDNATLSIDGRDSSGLSMVATLDTAGQEGKHVLLSPEDGGCCGWNGVVGSAVSFWRGNALYIGDARSGAIKKLAENLAGGNAVWNSFGHGGFFSDGERFLATIANGERLELRGITADGRSTLLRAFAKSDNLARTAVNGDLVAWGIRSRDSVTVFAARGPNGRARKLTTVRAAPNGRFFQLAWSFDATMLAITGLTVEPSLSVIHVDEAGAPRGAPTVLNPRATDPWTLRWTPDNRSLIVTATPTGARDGVVMRVPVDPKEAPTFYGRNDEWLFVSPDGKHVAYPAVRTLGTTIWRVDFVPPGGVGSSRKP